MRTDQNAAMGNPNYYDMLGVSLTASKKEIARAYRRMARQFHPDLQPPEQKQWAGEQMKRLNEAHAILGDAEARVRYDATVSLKSGVPKWTTSSPEEWFMGVPFQTRYKSRRWRKFLILVDFFFGLLLVYFLMAGAYFILVEWELFRFVLGPGGMPEFASQATRSQWMFAGIWYLVLIVTLFKAVPRRR